MIEFLRMDKYYDLYRLITSGIGREAAADLVPDDERLSQWREDYQSMSREMFYGDIPTFEEIVEVVATFQNEFNKGNHYGL